MDPFTAIGAVGSVVGILDVLVRVGSYLNDVQKSSKTIRGEIRGLEEEIEALMSVNETIESLKSRRATKYSPHADASNVWNAIDRNRDACKVVLLKLEMKLKFIVGKEKGSKTAMDSDKKLWVYHSQDEDGNAVRPNGQGEHGGERAVTETSISSICRQTPTGTIQGLKQTLRKQAVDPELAKIHQILSQYNQALSTLIWCLTFIYTQDTHTATDDLGDKMNANQSELLRHLRLLTLKVGSDTNHNLLQAIDVAKKVSAKSFNKYFSIPKPVKSYYTGREACLNELSTMLNDEQRAEYIAQKRFVVQGLGGSGKTQFCCKFAELNRQKFWGVFHINASSRETAQESFKVIARFGGVDESESAAKAWLSSLDPDQPWLLIVDNADDPNLEVDDFFPEGETGFILVTTRVHENIKHGTVGRKWFTFVGLESDSAITLLLTCAREKKPWSERTTAMAETIAEALGYLPLALVHAATAISKNICKLAEYLVCFKDAMAQLRDQTRKNKSIVQPRTSDVYLSVYSSYEVIYARLENDDTEESRDAIELLKIFSFFNRENIRVDILLSAAEVPGLEADAERKAKLAKTNSKTQDSWKLFLRKLIFALRTEILKDRSLPILPREQAAWSQAASNTLGLSIMLPVSGTPSATELAMQRTLLLHISHLRECKKEIFNSFNENLQARPAPMSFLPVIKPTLDTAIKDQFQAKQAAKFSYIYFICGHFDKAQELQEGVRDFLVPHLGLEHQVSMQISLFLAKTYVMSRSRFNDAALLTELVLEAARRELGNQHEITLGVVDELGVMRNYQGRFPEAEILFEEAINGRKLICGPEHRDTLCSIDNLGTVYWNLFDWDRAREHHLQAIAGMEKHVEMGADHERTLLAKEHLATTLQEMGAEYYEEAHALLEEVVAKRTKALGKESPWTLLAKSNLAYIKHAMGHHSEAEVIMRAGLVIAIRNLGKDHHGVLAAQSRFARILTAQEKYKEAEEIYIELLELRNYKGGLREDGAIKGDQKDRTFVLYQFVSFWAVQNKYDTALKFCEELCEVLKDSVHPIAEMAKQQRSTLLAAVEGKSYEKNPDTSNSAVSMDF